MAQEQDGWLSEEAMVHVAELLELTPAEVYGTASFYDMLFTEPVGRYLVSICTNIACLLEGAYELLEHAGSTLWVRPGSTTPDELFTLQAAACIADCGRAPCLAVTSRRRGGVPPAGCGPPGARLPRGHHLAEAPRGRARLPGRQRRRERARHLQGPPPHRARPPPDRGGHPHHGLRHRRGPGLHLRAGRVRPGPGAHDAGRGGRLRPRRHRGQH